MNIAPQIIILVLFGLRIMDTSMNHGKPDGEKNAGGSVLSALIVGGLLWWGGFWAPLFR